MKSCEDSGDWSRLLRQTRRQRPLNRCYLCSYGDDGDSKESATVTISWMICCSSSGGTGLSRQTRFHRLESDASFAAGGSGEILGSHSSTADSAAATDAVGISACRQFGAGVRSSRWCSAARTAACFRTTAVATAAT